MSRRDRSTEVTVEEKAKFGQMERDRNKPTDHLTAGERFIWNWRRGQASDFCRALVDLILRADPANLERIKAGFPEEVEAFASYGLILGWWSDLEGRMEDA